MSISSLPIETPGERPPPRLSPWQKFKNFALDEDLGKAFTQFRAIRLWKTGPFKNFLRFLPALLALLVLLMIFLLKDVPSPTHLATDDFPVSTQILDRNGALLYDIYADKNRTPIILSDLPPYVAEATVSIEDKNFYHHFGLDFAGIVRAALSNLSGQHLQGGSTLTQQLVKMTLLTPQRTFIRKIREAFLAIATEMLYRKDQILEMYLNHAPYGGTAYGIEQASKLYFGKHAKDLTLSEATLLAGLPQAPSRYSPFGANPDFWKGRQQEVLRRMREDGYITKEQEQEAVAAPISLSRPNVSIKAPHFVLWVKDLLVNQFDQQTVEKGGLRVTTTLDLPTQEMAEATVSAQIASLEKLRVGNGAALVTNPGTGEILAMVGSHDYFDTEHDGNVNITIRSRQPGSSIKPVMYATAFSLGKLTPSTMWLDMPTCFTTLNQPPYCPQNYDGTFHGPVQVRFALGNSYNLPAVKSLAYIGVPEMIATASAMGITTFTDPSRYGLSLTLGGGEVTMMDMAAAFGTLANEGVKVPLNPVLKIEDYKGNVLFERSEEQRKKDLVFTASSQLLGQQPTTDNQQPVRAIPKEPAYLVSHILLDNNSRSGAFGPHSKLIIPHQVVSVKTGTTNDLKDNWTIGYTPERLTAVWVGNNDGKPMNQSLVSGITGAAPIWHDIMVQILKGRKPIWPEKPDGVVGRDVCSLTGLLPTSDYSCETRHEFFWDKYLPGDNDSLQKDVLVRNDNGLPIDLNLPLDQQGDVSPQTHDVLSDPLIRDFCLDCDYSITQELNPDGTVKREYVEYPQTTIDIDKLRVRRLE